MWQNKTASPTPLGFLTGHDYSCPYGMNNAGQVVGTSFVYTNWDTTRAFLWQKKQPMQNLGVLDALPRSVAMAINDSGLVVGQSYGQAGPWHAFLCYDGAMGYLGEPAGHTRSGASDINNLGDVVGSSGPSSGQSYACWWHHGVATNLHLDAPSEYQSGYSSTYAINNLGQVVGWLYTNPASPYKGAAYVWQNHSMQLLPLLDGYQYATAMGINDLGQIVGFAGDGYTQSRAVLWNPVVPLDTSPPTTTISLSGTLGNNGWYTSDVQVTLSAEDEVGGSGVAKTEYSFNGSDWITYAAQFPVTAEGTTTVYYRSTDNAGNVEPTKTEAIKIDKTPPIISGSRTPDANANGWNNCDVTVHFEASDGLSGVESCTPDTVLSAEGADQSAVGTATDAAGNTASATVGEISIDKTGPQVTITVPSSVAYLLHQVVIADWAAEDSLSGLASAVGTVPSGAAIETATVGAKAFGVVAMDNAGNQTQQTVMYGVCYAYSGILRPINPDGSSIFKLGSTVPVKFQLTDAGGGYIADAIARIYVAKISDGIIGSEIEAESTSTATTGNLFRYDSTSDQYIFNLGTKPLSVGTWQIRILLDDETSKYVIISLR